MAHETGHYIDAKIGYASVDPGSEFYKIVYRLKNKFKGENGAKLSKIIKDDITDVIAVDNLELREYGGIQDIQNGLTRGESEMIYGHDTAYWKEYGRVQLETFANLFQILSFENTQAAKIQIKLIKKHYNALYLEFLDIIKKEGMK